MGRIRQEIPTEHQCLYLLKNTQIEYTLEGYTKNFTCLVLRNDRAASNQSMFQVPVQMTNTQTVTTLGCSTVSEAVRRNSESMWK